MKRHLNLMPNRERSHVRFLTHVRLWRKLLLVGVLLLIPLTILLGWPVYQGEKQVQVLASKYEPYRQLREASRSLNQRIEVIQVREKTTLDLVKHHIPVTSLLGLVGKSVAKCQGQAFVEEFNYHQDLKSITDGKKPEPTILVMNGRGIDETAVEQFLAALKTELPFGVFQLKTSKVATTNEQSMQKFIIECSF